MKQLGLVRLHGDVPGERTEQGGSCVEMRRGLLVNTAVFDDHVSLAELCQSTIPGWKLGNFSEGAPSSLSHRPIVTAVPRR